MPKIKLLVGLGNPGERYRGTRHNMGFIALDRLASSWNVAFTPMKKLNAEVAKATFSGADILLLKPQTFMNASGLSVAGAANYYKIAPEEILVLHDDLDLAPGRLKFKLGGGAGGHNGLKDIDAALKSNQYYRLRIGIGHPRDLVPAEARDTATAPHPNVIDYVLKPPAKAQAPLIDAAMARIETAIPFILAGEIQKAQQALRQE